MEVMDQEEATAGHLLLLAGQQMAEAQAEGGHRLMEIKEVLVEADLAMF